MDNRKISIALIIISILSMLLSISVVAVEGSHGNEWVYDEPQVISDETEAYIKDLNENVFAQYARKPQLAIVIINDLPYSIDRYKRDLFNEYGVGTAEENCGMLFIFAINDRQYALEIGDGFEKGSLLRRDLETDFITEDMKTSLRAGDYDSVTLQIAQHLAAIMADEENGSYAQWEKEKAETLAEAQKLKEQQAAARKAKMEAIINRVFVIGATILISICLVALVAVLIRNYLSKKKIQALCNGYAKYLHLAGTTEEEFTAYLKEHHSGIETNALEDEFLGLLHGYYIRRQKHSLLTLQTGLKQHHTLYQDAIEEVNNFEAFKRCQLTSLEMIIHQVDEAEQQKEEMRQQNGEIIEAFLQANRNRIPHEDTYKGIRNKLYKHRYSDRLVDEATLENTFAAALNEANFRWEVDRFVREQGDLAGGQHFNYDSFYAELAQTEQYRNYHYSRHYDHAWMRAMLITHIARRKRAHEEEIRRKEEQRKAEERRRREAEEAAALRRATEAMRSNNTSFGGGFKGGSSSGGGFKGGW